MHRLLLSIKEKYIQKILITQWLPPQVQNQNVTKFLNAFTKIQLYFIHMIILTKPTYQDVDRLDLVAMEVVNLEPHNMQVNTQHAILVSAGYCELT